MREIITNLLWSIKTSVDILNKLKSKGFLASFLSTYDFSTLYTALPHYIINEKLTEVIKQFLIKRAHFILLAVSKLH